MRKKAKEKPATNEGYGLNVKRRDGTKYGAEGESRTPTSVRPLDPEPSASTNSATSARRKEYASFLACCQLFFHPCL